MTDQLLRLEATRMSCCKAEEGQEAEVSALAYCEALSAALEIAASTPPPSDEAGHIASADPVADVLESAASMLDPLVSDNPEEAALLLERVVWDLIPRFQVSPATDHVGGASCSRCHTACSSIFNSAARTCSPREMFVLFLRTLTELGGGSGRAGGNARQAGGGLQLALLHAFATVLLRIERRQEHFLEEAWPVLLDLVASAAAAPHAQAQAYVEVVVEAVAAVARAAALSGASLQQGVRKERLQRELCAFALRLLLLLLPPVGPRLLPLASFWLAHLHLDMHMHQHLSLSAGQSACHRSHAAPHDGLGEQQQLQQQQLQQQQGVCVCMGLLHAGGRSLEAWLLPAAPAPHALPGGATEEQQEQQQQQQQEEGEGEGEGEEEGERAPKGTVAEQQRGVALAALWALSCRPAALALAGCGNGGQQLLPRVYTSLRQQEAVAVLGLAMPLLHSGRYDSLRGQQLIQRAAELCHLSPPEPDVDLEKALLVLQAMQESLPDIHPPSQRTSWLETMHAVLRCVFLPEQRMRALERLIDDSPHPIMVGQRLLPLCGLSLLS
eukprot:jgi/Mesen1/8609/ME000050S08028